MDQHVIDIIDAYTNARQIKGEDIKEGDILFDVFGGKHRVTKVTPFKYTVRTTRADGRTDTWGKEQTLTVLR